MTARNDITGDKIATKSISEEFRKGWDRIFGEKKKLEDLEIQPSEEPKIRPAQPAVVDTNGTD